MSEVRVAEFVFHDPNRFSRRGENRPIFGTLWSEPKNVSRRFLKLAGWSTLISVRDSAHQTNVFRANPAGKFFGRFVEFRTSRSTKE
jgi:hypothetical protein